MKTYIETTLPKLQAEFDLMIHALDGIDLSNPHSYETQNAVNFLTRALVCVNVSSAFNRYLEHANQLSSSSDNS